MWYTYCKQRTKEMRYFLNLLVRLQDSFKSISSLKLQLNLFCQDCFVRCFVWGKSNKDFFTLGQMNKCVLWKNSLTKIYGHYIRVLIKKFCSVPFLVGYQGVLQIHIFDISLALISLFMRTYIRKQSHWVTH